MYVLLHFVPTSNTANVLSVRAHDLAGPQRRIVALTDSSAVRRILHKFVCVVRKYPALDIDLNTVYVEVGFASIDLYSLAESHLYKLSAKWAS